MRVQRHIHMHKCEHIYTFKKQGKSVYREEISFKILVYVFTYVYQKRWQKNDYSLKLREELRDPIAVRKNKTKRTKKQQPSENGLNAETFGTMNKERYANNGW